MLSGREYSCLECSGGEALSFLFSNRRNWSHYRARNSIGSLQRVGASSQRNENSSSQLLQGQWIAEFCCLFPNSQVTSWIEKWNPVQCFPHSSTIELTRMSTDRGTAIKHDRTVQKSDDGEFPILCETCLGDNPYVRMIRIPYGKGCKSCGRPFTNFRWKAGSEGRYKSTQVCQLCAKTKNVCQCCVLDLTYGLPVQVRDTFLAQQQVLTVPREEANRGVYMQEMEKKVSVLLYLHK